MEEENSRHISVGDDLDDDEVIVIGSPKSLNNIQYLENQTEKNSIAKTTTIPDSELEGEPQSKSASTSVSQSKPKIEAAKVKKSREYHETTLEDLESQEAPLTQKIVVIAAIILIIVAILYFVIPK